MPSISSEIITYLKTKAAVTALVGSGVDARIFLDEAKQGVSLPYVTLVVFEGASHEHLGAITGLAENRVEINCYSATSEGAWTLAEVIRLSPLQMHRGTLGSTFVHSITSPQGYARERIPPPQGSNTTRFVCSRDYFFIYAEAKT